MNILAFDTCFDACSAAVAVDAGSFSPSVAARFEPMARGQAERLMPMIAEVLAEAGLTARDIHRIAVANGPGTFTGTRIAVSAARALALATGAEIVALSSLEMMARNVEHLPLEPGRDLAIAVNANRGEVYWQTFSGEARTPKSPPLLLKIEDGARLAAQGPLLIAGSGASAVAAAARAPGTDIREGPASFLPRAGDIVNAAVRMTPLSLPLAPLYLRPPDARPQDGKSLARAQ
jgi:tRNA threonylcarbamoyladenosine biosynthesis protein TsaB